MIPQVARKLIEEYSPKGPLNLLFDPYMGSGTSLVEASVAGIDSIGTDINPLARLISRVKTTYYNEDDIKHVFSGIQGAIFEYATDKVVNTNFEHITNCDYWYSDECLYKLSYLTQIIEGVDLSVKEFFELALAEVVRDVSFTRNGEFKRFRMEEDRIKSFDPDTFRLFEGKIVRNLEGLKEFKSSGHRGTAKIYDFNSSVEIPESIVKEQSVDLVVTSPPYGDSRTTVAYGQFSRWANEWFGFENAKNLDNLLMGGQIKKQVNFRTETVSKELDAIKKLDPKRYIQVISFLNDYYDSIKNVSKVIRSGGRVCYVIGNRTVKGIQIPLDYFTAEMFEKNDFKHEITFVRSIPNKRMPGKTSPTNKTGATVSTMNREYIVILTKN